MNSDGVVDALDTAHWLNAWKEYVNGASGQTPPKEIWKGVADANEDDRDYCRHGGTVPKPTP